METERIAIADLGTNTFHLLVMDVPADGPSIQLHKEKRFVKLARNGIHHFNEEVMQGAISVLKDYAQIADDLGVKKIIATATAAFRNSKNSLELKDRIKKETGIDVQIISGDREAELIYYGVRQSLEMTSDDWLIMDIGGGSIEFILANDKEIFWAKSFPIGAAILRNQFHLNEPISSDEIESLNKFLEEHLQELNEVMKNRECYRLIGASGSFDTILDIELTLKNESPEPAVVSAKVSIETFQKIYEDLISKNLEERKATKGMTVYRADMMVVAIIVVDYIIRNYKISALYKSDYALKEGIVWEQQQDLFKVR